MHSIVTFFKLFFTALKEWISDRCIQASAALAFFLLLALGPLVGFILYISGKALGAETTKEFSLPFVKDFFTPQFVNIILYLLNDRKHINLAELSTINVMAAILLIWAGKCYFAQIRQSIESTWGKKRDEVDIKLFIYRTKKEIILTIGTLAVFLFFIFLRFLLPHPFLNEDNEPLSAIALVATELLMFFCLFFFYFIYIPPVNLSWKEIIPGVLFGAISYTIGREILRMHMNSSPNMDLTESLLAVLLWNFYISMILVFSSEFNRVYINHKRNESKNSVAS